jgi:hypothetical protein
VIRIYTEGCSVTITATYGSFDTYLRDAVKLSDADRAALRQRLLEP